MYESRKMARFIVVTFGVLSTFLCLSGKDMKAKPFVKWAGGKGQLIEQLDNLLPKDFLERRDMIYAEPFVGGGAMLFHVLDKYRNIRHAVINDLNLDLVTCYKVIKDKPEALIASLYKLQDTYRSLDTMESKEEMFLSNRDRYNSHKGEDVEIAALFIFLNRTCFNGLYRVNSKGLFNVPFGKSTNPLICDEDTIRADSRLLQKVEILNCDFEQVESSLGNNAFIYFDPPYRPLTQTASFTAYAKNGFNDNEQRRLAAFCRRLDKSGHKWLLSNSDPHNIDPSDMFFEEIYSGFDIHRVSASRMINSNASGRGKITELAIRNYQE